MKRSSPQTYAAVALALAVNAIPILGLFGFGWSPATTLAVFWCETVLAGLFVLARMLVHRALTHKRGYYRGGKGAGSWTFILAYLQVLVLLAPVTALFLGLLVFVVFDGGRGVSLPDVREGLMLVGVVLLLSFGTDCAGIGERPFSWIKGFAERSLGRMAILIFALLLGGFAFSLWHHSVSFFAVFIALKVWIDVDAALLRARGGSRSTAAPRWQVWLAERRGPRSMKNLRDSEAARERLAVVEAHDAKEDEWVRAPRPPRPPNVAIDKRTRRRGKREERWIRPEVEES